MAALGGPWRCPLGVEVQAGDGVVAFGVLWLFLNGQGLTLCVKFHYAKAFRIANVIAKHRSVLILLRILNGLSQCVSKAAAVKDVIPQHHAGVVADEGFSQQNRLSQSVRAGLHHIAEADAKLTAIPQQLFKAGRIRGGGDNENVLNARQHQRGELVVDHGLVIDGQELFGCNHGKGVQACACAAGEDDALHDAWISLIACIPEASLECVGKTQRPGSLG